MRVLVACERSGVVRRAFRAQGHNAWSCDLEPAEDCDPHHLQGDVLDVINASVWDLLIAHPPCTYLCASGLHWTNGWTESHRVEQAELAVEFALALWNAPIKRVCLENPVGILSTRIRSPDQIIQPYNFGENASKATCLWLSSLPLLRPTDYIAPRYAGGGLRWANQTDSGQNRLSPSPDRPRLRAQTYPGIAKAMAEQWGASSSRLISPKLLPL